VVILGGDAVNDSGVVWKKHDLNFK
jgi:hypothetical protein